MKKWKRKITAFNLSVYAGPASKSHDDIDDGDDDLQ